MCCGLILSHKKQKVVRASLASLILRRQPQKYPPLEYPSDRSKGKNPRYLRRSFGRAVRNSVTRDAPRPGIVNETEVSTRTPAHGTHAQCTATRMPKTTATKTARNVACRNTLRRAAGNSPCGSACWTEKYRTVPANDGHTRQSNQS